MRAAVGVSPSGMGIKFLFHADIFGHASVELEALTRRRGESWKTFGAVTVVWVMGSLQGDHHCPVAFLPVPGIGPGRDYRTGQFVTEGDFGQNRFTRDG